MNAKANPFTLDTENKKFLGVCAGLANFLEVPTVVIRVITFLACITWPTLIIVYFVAYWWLKHQSKDDSVHHFFTDSKPGRHFRTVDFHKEIYRNPYNSRIAGVCSGIADYLEIKTFYVRMLTLLSFFLFGPFTFFAYLVCWIVLEKNPEPPVRMSRKQRRRARKQQDTMNADEPDMADETMSAHSQSQRTKKATEDNIAMSLKDCANTFQTVETRLRDVEAFITSKKFRLHCEINRI